MKRKIAAAAALTAVLLVQLTVVNGLALPGGGMPDLVLLCVVALGLTSGPAAGLIAGFCAGLALDLAPPASELVGQYALGLCLVGYWSGRLRFTLRHSAVLAIAAAAAMAAVGETIAAVLTLTLDTPEVTWATVTHVLPASALYDALLGPLVLLCWVRSAVALGVSFDPRDDSPAMETGGSAAPVTLAGGTAVPGRPIPRQAGQRLAIGGDSRAAASGRWLVGDVAEAAPAVGAVGWLAGPVRSRRARREQARLTAMVTGASARKGAIWVGRRPPGLVPVQPPPPARTRGLKRLRPGSGVAGTAVAPPRPGPGLVRRPVHLGLAEDRRRRARSAARSGGRAAGLPGGGEAHGAGGHGVSGPSLPSISFGGGFVRRAGLPQGRAVPRIAFGTGSLPGAGGPAGRRVPRIAFAARGAASAETVGTGRTGAGRGGAGRYRDAWIGQGPLGARTRGTPRLRLAPRRSGVTEPGPRLAAPRFASGQWLGGSAGAGAGLGLAAGPGGTLAATGHLGASVIARPVRKAKRPRFARSASGHQVARSRRPKTAKMSAGRRPFRRLPWLKRAGDRSTVWRIGSRRTGGYR